MSEQVNSRTTGEKAKPLIGPKDPQVPSDWLLWTLASSRMISDWPRPWQPENNVEASHWPAAPHHPASLPRMFLHPDTKCYSSVPVSQHLASLTSQKFRQVVSKSPWAKPLTFSSSFLPPTLQHEIQIWCTQNVSCFNHHCFYSPYIIKIAQRNFLNKSSSYSKERSQQT